MDLLALADSPAATFIASFSPSLRDLLEFVRGHRELMEKSLPVIKAAAKEGPAVIDAVRKNAPELIEALKGLIAASASPRAPVRAALASDLPMENALRTLAGVPRLSHGEEKAWIDRASPISEDSRSGSG